MQNATELGDYLLDALKDMQTRHELIGDVRGLGLMIGIEIVANRETREPAKATRDQIINEAFARGLLLLGAGESVIRLMPPLSVDRAAADEGLRLFEESLSAVEAQLAS
jgi:4-aminobutyrate aminotransferase